MTRYVVGFAFTKGLGAVILIRKNRPAWQKGLANGIGGHIEEGEDPIDAMVREFREETGVGSEPEDWKEFAVLSDMHNFEINFFYSRTIPVQNVQSTTDEEIEFVSIHDLVNVGSVPNLQWLVPMALSFEQGERATKFAVAEING